MTWNYRVIRKGKDYGIHEVYYDDDANPVSLSETSVVPVESGVEELRERLELLLEALTKVALEFDAFRFKERSK